MIPAKYSLRWANGVIEDLKRKHARGTEDVKNFLGITDRNLAAFLATNDPIFPHLRNLIKESEQWSADHPDIGSTTHLLTYIRMRMPEELRERLWVALDRGRKRSKLKEQESRGADLRSESDEGQLPLVFS